jgi:hypothetical protein
MRQRALHFALNTIFLTACKFCNFLASAAVTIKIESVFAHFFINAVLGAQLSELNVKLRGCALLRSPA